MILYYTNTTELTQVHIAKLTEGPRRVAYKSIQTESRERIKVPPLIELFDTDKDFRIYAKKILEAMSNRAVLNRTHAIDVLLNVGADYGWLRYAEVTLKRNVVQS